MVTWMQHPQHGKHPAAGEEIERLKKAGWTLCPPKVKPVENSLEPATPSIEVEVTAVELPQEPPRRGPGRPPRNAGVGYGVRSDSN